MRTVATRAALRTLRTGPAAVLARAAAAARGRAVVLCYHRVSAEASGPNGIVPTIPIDLLRRHLHALAEVADIVPLERVLVCSPGRRPRVALTFDDDDPGHATCALPVLRALGVPATFFLSGRALHGLGAYWFQQLERVIEARGLESTARFLGLPGSGAAALARACEAEPALQQQVAGLAADHPAAAMLDRAGIAALVDGGMRLGFHTLDHQVLTALPDDVLDRALQRGRDELATAAGHPLLFFAYPHGKADARTAAAVSRSGYVGACTGRPVPVRRGQDPYRIGRWEPGAVCVDDLLARFAVRLLRAAPPMAGAE